MESGYVLNFSDRTFASFFAEELKIDIDADIYRREGSSKAKRLRCFLRTTSNATACRALRAIWDYRELLREQFGEKESVPKARERLEGILARLGDKVTPDRSLPQSTAPKAPSRPVSDLLVALGKELLTLSALPPHERGYAFEKFLKQMFDAHSMQAKDAFRLRGEQIDGSFVFDGNTYLLEAKWQNARTDIADLHTFHGKLEQKAQWTRGLFISISGVSPDALHAFGRGKRLICMDGFDLSEMLSRNIPLGRVLEEKSRHAAETGAVAISVRELFPS